MYYLHHCDIHLRIFTILFTLNFETILTSWSQPWPPRDPRDPLEQELGSGGLELISCSGGPGSGSLRFIQVGIPLEDLGSDRSSAAGHMSYPLVMTNIANVNP